MKTIYEEWRTYMSLFSHEKISTLNQRELKVYNYVVSHTDRAVHMNIRDLSCETGVSTTTIMRFCEKLGCSGYTEFKYQLNRENDRITGAAFHTATPLSAIQYLQNASSNPELDKTLEQAAQMCLDANQILLIGTGTSGSMAQYASRFLANVGLSAVPILDSFYPVPVHDIPDTLVIAFSVSGETAEIISMLNGYKQKKARTISITNTEKSTIARMTDLNFSYYMPVICIYSPVRELNMTTSIPICYLIEALTHKIYEYQKNYFR